MNPIEIVGTIGMLLLGGYVVYMLYDLWRECRAAEAAIARIVSQKQPPPRPDLDTQLGGYSGPRPNDSRSNDSLEIAYRFCSGPFFSKLLTDYDSNVGL